MLSIIGAQRNLIVYGVVLKANKPIFVLFTPTSMSHIDNVERSKTNGKPLAKPRNKIIISFLSE